MIDAPENIGLIRGMLGLRLWNKHDDNDQSNAIAYTRSDLVAELAAQLAGKVKVKPLEWSEVMVGRWAADVEGFPFHYTVRINLKGHIRIKTFGLYEVFNGTLDEAFAYVQADHERRVRKLVGGGN